MKDLDWARVRSVFDEIVELSSGERTARLAALNESAPEIVRVVEPLLSAANGLEVSLNSLTFLRDDDRGTSDFNGSAPDPLGLASTERGHFRIRRVLGSGGMAVVYLAEDVRLRRDVALKFLNQQYQLDPSAKQRFLLEARAAAALDHPNICTVYEIGDSDEGLFIAMACYSGGTLKERLAREGALSVDSSLEIASQILHGLTCAHEHGIVHRDLKPGNIMLCNDGVVRILDFGLAKVQDVSLTGSGLGMGTLRYMSPEQLTGDLVDVRSDLWSFGVVLVEMLTGIAPLPGAEGVRNAVTNGGQRAPIPDALLRIAEKLHRSEPSQRYASAREILDALSAARSGAAAHSQPRFSRRVTRLTSLAIGAAALTSGVMIVPKLASRVRPPVGTAAAASPRYSLAVLPLENHSSSTGQEFFALGVTDEITATLSKIEGLRVISHQSVLQFRTSDRPAKEIAGKLGVRYVVDGSVAVDGGRVRVIASLTDADRDTRVWTERFERELRDVMSLQHDIALAVARGIQLALSADDSTRLKNTRLVDPVAFEEYLKGTQSRYAGYVTNDFGDAAVHFERAIARDPTYAPAYAGLAFVRAMSGNPRRGRELVNRALNFDSLSADAYVTDGIVRQVLDWDWGGAEASFRTAIRLNPGHAEAYHELGMLLLRLRRFDEALEATERSMYLAPLSVRFVDGSVEVLYYAGRYGEMMRASALSRTLAPTSLAYDEVNYAMLHGNPEQTLRMLDSLTRRGFDMSFAHAYIRARMGQSGEALTILKRLEGEWTHVPTSQLDGQAAGIAALLLITGQRQQALDWLEKGVVHGTVILYLGVSPFFEPLRREPRFRAIMQRIRLPYASGG